MKKLLASLLALTLVLGSAAITGGITFVNDTTITASAEGSVSDGEYDGWKYVELGDKIVIYNYFGDETEVTVPEKINGKTVTELTGAYFDGDGFHGDNSTFSGTDVQTINVPASVKSIDDYFLFAGKSVKTINVDKDNANYASYDGMLFNKDMTIMLDCPEGKEGDIVVPNGVIGLGDGSEDWRMGVFEDCQNISSVVLPESVKSINTRTFRWCKSLTHVDLANSNIVGYNGLNELEFAFSGCDALKAIDVNDENENLKSVDGVLYNKDMTTCIMIPARKENVNIPASVTDIRIFPLNFSYYRIWCKNIKVDESNMNYFSIDGALYTYDRVYDAELDKVVLNYDRKVLLYYPMGVENAIIPEGINEINSCAFFNHSELKSVQVPSTVDCIRERAFLNCRNLNSVTLPDIPINTTCYIYNGTFGYYYENPLLASVGLKDPSKETDFIIFCNPDTDGERYAEENGFKHYLPGTVIEPDDSSSSAPDSSEKENPDDSENETSSSTDDDNSTSSVDDNSSEDSSNTDNSSDNEISSSNTQNGSSTSNKANESANTNPNTGAAAGLSIAALGLGAVLVAKRRK